MSSGLHTQAEVLLIKAAEDENALQARENSDAIIGFHAQQSIEKLLRALLSSLKLPFESTHNLDRLKVALEAAGENLPLIPVPWNQLTDYAVIYRYDLLFQITPPDRAQLISAVRVVREYVIQRIAALTPAP